MDNNISHSRHDQLIEVMLRYDTGMAKQIQHFLKVYEFAHLIGTAEGWICARRIFSKRPQSCMM